METESKMNLPAKLTALRKQKGLTQMDLAEKLGVSRQAISRWEVGTAAPSTDNLKTLSDLYGVPVDYLLNDDSENAAVITESQEPEKNMPSGKQIHKRHLMLLAVAAILTVALVLFHSWNARKQEQSKNAPIPIGDLTIDETENDYPIETFNFEW